MLRRSKSKKFKDTGKLFYSLSLRLDLKPPGVSMVRFYRMTKFYLIFLKLSFEYAKGFILGALISPRNEKYLVSPIILLHYSANFLWEYSNLSGRDCCRDLTPNSRIWFIRKLVAARGENYQSALDLNSHNRKRTLLDCAIAVSHPVDHWSVKLYWVLDHKLLNF